LAAAESNKIVVAVFQLPPCFNIEVQSKNQGIAESKVFARKEKTGAVQEATIRLLLDCRRVKTVSVGW
jgi:hypothetical protein